MTTITGTLRDSKVEFHGPTPAAWIDGMEVNVSAEELIDPQGDSPESHAAWCRIMDEVELLGHGSSVPDELELVLQEAKRVELARWEQDSRRSGSNLNPFSTHTRIFFPHPSPRSHSQTTACDCTSASENLAQSDRIGLHSAKHHPM